MSAHDRRQKTAIRSFIFSQIIEKERNHF